ncbi:plasmid replication initiator protein [Streptomyces griseocarneus]|uniref:Plasmid replication initiator protein n=1 Tax=Streptomyces griseocarneus TaxID=51201 RepID=A0ABX7RWF8_9ACTN|nr:plasmid replication initiator protein [Streptomyces griseocarneus]
MRLANDPLFPRWLEQVAATGGCAHPIHLSGHTTTYDAATGEILHHYSTRDEPGERLLVRCRNRRASVCPSCSRLHAGDTYHLVRAGLTGGKGVPATVQEHPQLFLTLTAPSFGPVHHATADGQRCRPRRNTAPCQHGRLHACTSVHEPTDPLIGQPLCPGCYDYTAHILWHAHAGELWSRFTRNVRRYLAGRAGITRSRFHEHARLSFAKVAEYQRRGAIHLHAVARIDGPTGPADQPPTWATADLLTAAVQAATQRVLVRTPHSAAIGELGLRWGTQLDVHPIGTGRGTTGPDDEAVAAYIAKYVTKDTGTTGAGGTDHRITGLAEIDHIHANAHARTLMRTCWRLGGLAEYKHLRLRAWTHTLGYRGHILTKSRAYSTTYEALRADRAEYERHTPQTLDSSAALTEAHWRYIGSGHTSGAALVVAGIAEDHERSRRLYREAGQGDVCSTAQDWGAEP